MMMISEIKIDETKTLDTLSWVDLRDYKIVCEKVSTKFLARLFWALLWFKELINRVLVYCVLPGVF